MGILINKQFTNRMPGVAYSFRINGQMAKDETVSAGENVLVLGKVKNIKPHTRVFNAELTDGSNCQITLRDPVERELDGFIEFKGQIDHKKNIVCDSMVRLNEACLEDFDKETYNQAIAMLSQYKNYIV